MSRIYTTYLYSVSSSVHNSCIFVITEKRATRICTIVNKTSFLYPTCLDIFLFFDFSYFYSFYLYSTCRTKNGPNFQTCSSCTKSSITINDTQLYIFWMQMLQSIHSYHHWKVNHHFAQLTFTFIHPTLSILAHYCYHTLNHSYSHSHIFNYSHSFHSLYPPKHHFTIPQFIRIINLQLMSLCLRYSDSNYIFVISTLSAIRICQLRVCSSTQLKKSIGY